MERGGSKGEVRVFHTLHEGNKAGEEAAEWMHCIAACYLDPVSCLCSFMHICIPFFAMRAVRG